MLHPSFPDPRLVSGTVVCFVRVRVLAASFATPSLFDPFVLYCQYNKYIPHKLFVVFRVVLLSSDVPGVRVHRLPKLEAGGGLCGPPVRQHSGTYTKCVHSLLCSLVVHRVCCGFLGLSPCLSLSPFSPSDRPTRVLHLYRSSTVLCTGYFWDILRNRQAAVLSARFTYRRQVVIHTHSYTILFSQFFFLFFSLLVNIEVYHLPTPRSGDSFAACPIKLRLWHLMSCLQDDDLFACCLSSRPQTNNTSKRTDQRHI